MVIPENFKKRTLFLFENKPCLNLIAEGWARHLHPLSFEAYAFFDTPDLLPTCLEIGPATQAMKEVGIEINMEQCKVFPILPGQPNVEVEFEVVVTNCQSLPSGIRLAKSSTVFKINEEEHTFIAGDLKSCLGDKTLAYQDVREQIRVFVRELPEILNNLRNNGFDPKVHEGYLSDIWKTLE